MLGEVYVEKRKTLNNKCGKTLRGFSNMRNTHEKIYKWGKNIQIRKILMKALTHEKNFKSVKLFTRNYEI